jgi:hypothetical protein
VKLLNLSQYLSQLKLSFNYVKMKKAHVYICHSFIVIVVGIATGYGLDVRWVEVGVAVGSIIFLLHIVQTGSGVHSTSYSVGVKRPRREADHSPPASAEFKEIDIYTSTPPYIILA